MHFIRNTTWRIIVIYKDIVFLNLPTPITRIYCALHEDTLRAAPAHPAFLGSPGLREAVAITSKQVQDGCMQDVNYGQTI